MTSWILWYMPSTHKNQASNSGYMLGNSSYNYQLAPSCALDFSVSLQRPPSSRHQPHLVFYAEFGQYGLFYFLCALHNTYYPALSCSAHQTTHLSDQQASRQARQAGRQLYSPADRYILISWRILSTCAISRQGTNWLLRGVHQLRKRCIVSLSSYDNNQVQKG